MRRFWFGCVLLAALLASGLFSAGEMGQAHENAAQLLEQAARPGTEDMDAQLQLAHQAQALWRSRWHLTAAVADLGNIEQIDALFAQLETAAEEDDRAELTTLCAELAVRIRAMGDSQRLSWWNIL